MASAVHALHQAGLLHGELRPENIILLTSSTAATSVSSKSTPSEDKAQALSSFPAFGGSALNYLNASNNIVGENVTVNDPPSAEGGPSSRSRQHPLSVKGPAFPLPNLHFPHASSVNSSPSGSVRESSTSLYTQYSSSGVKLSLNVSSEILMDVDKPKSTYQHAEGTENQ